MTQLELYFILLDVLSAKHFLSRASQSTAGGYIQPLPLVIPITSSRERVYTHPLKGISSQLGLIKGRHFRTNFSDTNCGYTVICTLTLIT